jgi:threonyl-tRNA synthetase
MPLNAKGKTIMSAMRKEYGEKKGERVFYGAKNKGTIKGVEKKRPTRRTIIGSRY